MGLAKLFGNHNNRLPAISRLTLNISIIAQELSNNFQNFHLPSTKNFIHLLFELKLLRITQISTLGNYVALFAYRKVNTASQLYQKRFFKSYFQKRFDVKILKPSQKFLIIHSKLFE